MATTTATITFDDYLARLVEVHHLEFAIVTLRPSGVPRARRTAPDQSDEDAAHGKAPKKQKARGMSGSRVEGRRRTAAILEYFDGHEPKGREDHPIKPTARALGALVRRGYLKRRGDRYLRTAKVWHLNPTGQA